MKKQFLLTRMLLLCALIIGSVSSAWGEEITYTFNSKSWEATVDEEEANWTSGKDGAGFSNNGIQVTTAFTGANATSPTNFDNITKIVVTYNTNKSAGNGTLDVKVGSNEAVSKNWSYSGSGDGRTANFTVTYDFATPQSGAVTLTAKTTTNSIYLVSVTITYTTNAPNYTLSSSVSPTSAGSVELGSTSIINGGKTTITAKPNSGYRFVNWKVTGTGASVSDATSASTTFTMGSEDATVTANFEAIVYHAITYSVNGVASSPVDIEEGEDIPLSAPASGIPSGYAFIGWTTTPILALQNDLPETVPSATSTTDITYYAVLGKVESSTPESWTEEELSNMTASDVFVFANGSFAMKNDGGTSDAPGKVDLTIEDGKITSEVSDNIKWQVTGNPTDGYTFYPNGSTTTWLYCNTTASSKSNDNIRIGTGNRKVWVFDTNGYLITNDTYTGRYLSYYAGGPDFRGYVNTDNNPFVPTFYKLIPGSTVYAGYCTTVTATITLSSACTDGEKYYGTYSNSSAFVVPADLTVSAISVAGNKLTVKNYNEGDIVKADTGVMVSSTTAGDHTIVLSNETGSEIAGNMLKASGDAGIKAATMNEANTAFYRLTMHNTETIGFYWGAANGAAFDIAANKAYLAVPDGAGARIAGFNLFEEEGEATAIEGVKTIGTDAPVFNLNGQRVNGNAKGLLIKNGKKFMNR